MQMQPMSTPLVAMDMDAGKKHDSSSDSDKKKKKKKKDKKGGKSDSD